MSGTQMSLLELPLELREKIYGYVIGSDDGRLSLDGDVVSLLRLNRTIHNELLTILVRVYTFVHLVFGGSTDLAERLRAQLDYAPFDHVEGESDLRSYGEPRRCFNNAVASFKHYHMCMKVAKPQPRGSTAMHMMLIGQKALEDFVILMMEHEGGHDTPPGRQYDYKIDFNHVGASDARERLEERLCTPFTVNWFCVDTFDIKNATDVEASYALIERIKTRKCDKFEDAMTEAKKYQVKGKEYFTHKDYSKALQAWRTGDRILWILSKSFESPDFGTAKYDEEVVGKARYYFQQNNLRTCAFLALARSSDKEEQFRARANVWYYAVSSVNSGNHYASGFRASAKDLGMAWYRRSRAAHLLGDFDEFKGSLRQAQELLHPDELRILKDGTDIAFIDQGID